MIDLFTSQCLGQWKSLQLFVSSRIGQDAPPYAAWVTISLPLLLCPVFKPQLQDLEQELHSPQVLTCTFVGQCLALNLDLNTMQLTGQWKSLQVLVLRRTGQGIPPFSASLLIILPRRLSPKPHGFEQELHLFQELTLVGFVQFLSFVMKIIFYWCTSQSIGQGKWLQLLVSSRTGQDAPPYVGFVITSLPLRLCPGFKPQWQDLEQELQSPQVLTWVDFFASYSLCQGNNYEWYTSQSMDSTQISLKPESIKKDL